VAHALVFLVTGIVFGLGYELRMSVMCAAIVFCAALELLQLAVPGRDAAQAGVAGIQACEPAMA
jgi:hypothetical protein